MEIYYYNFQLEEAYISIRKATTLDPENKDYMDLKNHLSSLVDEDEKGLE